MIGDRIVRALDFIRSEVGRKSTTVTLPAACHRWAREMSYDLGIPQQGVIGAVIALAASEPDTAERIRAIVEASRADDA